jgi:TfoX N-terminal domain
MAYDEELAGRIRELVAGEPDLTEQRMFGGLAFLIAGNMAVAASGQGGALVRADPLQTDDLVATTDADAFEMRGRSMQGWLRVAPEHLQSQEQLTKWVALGTAYARSLPAKR